MTAVDDGTLDGAGPSRVDTVYDVLLAAILELRLRAGTALSQNKLAAQLGVSRTPIREALMRLEREGLVQRIPEMGFAVAAITAAEVNEACDLLELLDAYVYRRASEALAPPALAELETLAAELVRSADAGDAQAWKEVDDRFHRIVIDAAGNRFVAEYVQLVRRRVQRFWLPEPHFDGRLRTCSQDHVALAAAVREGDAALLAELVQEHIRRMRQNVLDRLESAGPLLPDGNPLGAVRLGP